MIAEALRKLIARVPVLARMVKSAPGQHLVQTARGAGVVDEKARFAARQLARPGVAGYSLRGSGLRVFVRHEAMPLSAPVGDAPTGDVHILNEIFGGTGGQYAYDPPAAVAAILDGHDGALKVLDLGGNIGLFGAYVLGRWPGARIHSFEPEPANQAILARVIAANGLGDSWARTDAAVANYTGEMTFASGLFADSHPLTDAQHAGGVAHNGNGEAALDAPPAGGTITVPTVDLFAQDHVVDLLKMDIEGGEWSILTDPRLSDLGAKVIVLEWHDRGCPEHDARETAARLLREAGYVHQEEVEVATHNGVVWAWR